MRLRLGVLAFWLSAFPAFAGDTLDGVYRGVLACSATRDSPAFEWAIAFVVRNGRLTSERGLAGANGWERLTGVISDNGTVVVEGRYVAGIEKPIHYTGHIDAGRLRGEGQRGPRRCSLNAEATPKSGVRPPYRGISYPESRRFPSDATRTSSFACRQPIAPIRDLTMAPFYRRDDPTHSIVDADALSAHARAVAPLRVYLDGIAKMGDRWLAGEPHPAPVAACMAEWLDIWASAHAMLGAVSRQGSSERKWALATLALNYVLLARVPGIDADRRRRIEEWLGDLAWAMVPDDARKPFADQNNHLNWAALSALSVAVAIQDDVLFDWAVDAARGAIANIADDGSLPHELRRAARATNYHIFALRPLILTAEIAAANGLNLYAEREGALLRLVTFTQAAIADPNIVTRRVGVPQERPAGRPLATDIAWMVPYMARFDTAPVPAPMRATAGAILFDRWLGGDLKVRFGLPATTEGR